MRRSFQSKVCVVTGAAKGLGRCMVLDLAKAGAIVAAMDVDPNVEEVARSCAPGAHVETHIVDVTDREGVAAAVQDVAKKHGRLDYMFNNAGINTMSDFRDVPLDYWQKAIDVNLWGVIHGTEIAYEQMVRQGHGHIVNIASGLGLVPAPRNIPYATTKFAVVGLSESLRIEARDLGVDVSVVCPGWVATPQVTKGRAILGPDRETGIDEATITTFPLPKLTTEKAARAILRGVLKKKSRIAFPAYVPLTALIYRLFPRLADMWFLHEIRGFRKMRDRAVEAQTADHASDETVRVTGHATEHDSKRLEKQTQ